MNITSNQNIFKLSQGEYIAPEKIENTYSQCTLVAQVFVYGESIKSTLVGIVIPDQVVLEIWCRNNNINGSFIEMCRNKVRILHLCYIKMYNKLDFSLFRK